MKHGSNTMKQRVNIKLFSGKETMKVSLSRLRVRSPSKRMVRFWVRKGLLSIDCFSWKSNFNVDYYICKLEDLRVVVKQESCGRLTGGVILLHDNARPHVSRKQRTPFRAFIVFPTYLTCLIYTERLLVIWGVKIFC